MAHQFSDKCPIKAGAAVRVKADNSDSLPLILGLISKNGIQLPLPRRSLGVEFWHKGNPDNFFILLPRNVDAPCSARQVFTTLHDNQQNACILVLYGDDPVASKNMLLGQFDIVNIPPAPKDVPKIEVGEQSSSANPSIFLYRSLISPYR